MFGTFLEYYNAAYIGMVNGKRTYKTLLMHRFIAGDPYKKEVDHRDENKLNNKKSNLRVCIRSQNKHNVGKFKNNTSGFKGVGLVNKRWRAKIMVNYKNIHLGYFSTAIEAAKAYNNAAKTMFGEFHKPNKISEEMFMMLEGKRDEQVENEVDDFRLQESDMVK